MWRSKKVFLASLAWLGLSIALYSGPASAQLVTSGSVAGEDNLAPAPVTDVVATPDLAGTSVTLSWTLAADDSQYAQAAGMDFTSGGTFVSVNDVAGYNVWRQDGDADPVVIATLDAGESEYQDANLISGVMYTYGVSAVDAAGNESAAVYAPAVSLGPPPSSTTTLPALTPRFRVTMAGTLPANLPQFEQDFAAVIAQLLGLPPSAIRVIAVRAGSIIVDFEIVDPNAEALGDQLDQTLTDNPDAIAETGAELGTTSEFGPVTGQSSLTGADIDFGTVDAAAAATQTIDITNNSTDPEALLVVSTELSGAGFSVDPASASLAQNETATFTVTFDPAQVGGINGTYTGILIISTNDPDNPQTTVGLTATVTGGVNAQEIELSAATVQFGQVQYGTSATVALTIRNTGDLELTGTVVLAGDAAFTTQADSTFAIAGGDSVVVEISFAPADTVEYSATLTVTSNDTDEPVVTVPVTGSGVTEVVLLLPEDFNGDNRVTLDDFFLFADNFGTNSTMANFDPAFDLDQTGDVGLSDFFLFADHFGYSIADGQVLDAAGNPVSP